MALVDPLRAVNAAFPGAIDSQREIADMFIAAQLVEAPGEKLSGFGFHGAYQYFCELHGLTPLGDGAFGGAIRRAFPSSNQAAWPTEDGRWLWIIEGVRLANAQTTRELLYLLSGTAPTTGITH